MPKVFLSYSRQDSAFVEELYRRLTRDGVVCFYDQESIAWGSNWVRELEQGLEEAELVVVVLTPAFVESKWTELERTAALATHSERARDRLRPLLRAECTIPAFLRTIQSIDVTTAERFELNYQRICRQLGGTPRSDSLPAERSRLPSVAALPARHRMPYRSLASGFAGRTAELWELHDALTESGVAVVAGLGGLGKTQLATEYAHRFAGFYPGGIFWTDAEQGIETVIRQIAMAAEIQIDGKSSIEEQRQHLYNSLARAFASVLLVFDNVSESTAVVPWLPTQSTIRTIITTRRRDLSRFQALPLQPLDEVAGLDLLNKGTRDFGSDATELVAILDGLPLALELARNFLNQRPELSVAGLLQEMGKLGDMAALRVFENNYRDQLPTGHIKEVGATFQLSWNLASPGAQRALAFMAQLAPVSIPRFLLRRAFGDGDSRLTDPVDTWVTELARLSLVELDKTFDPRVHRLIGGFVASMPIDDELRLLVINTLARELERVRDDQDLRAYAELERVLPHAEKIVQADQIESERAIDMLGDLARQYRRQGRPRLAERLARRALAMAEQSFEAGDPVIGVRQSNLAVVLKDLGELAEARDLLRAALASAERTFEPGHSSIAGRQSNLALVLKDLGQLAEARELLRAALATDERNFASGHPRIAVTKSNLAMVLQDLGELAEARDLLCAALAVEERAFERGHPRIALTQSNLATVLQDLGELAEARDLLRVALAADERTFEPGHPNIAVSQSNLALVLKDLGELAEARDLLRAALDANKRSFEPGHPVVAARQANLALVLRDLGNLDEACDLLHDSLAAAERALPPGHPTVAVTQFNLALVLNDLGKLAEARDLLRAGLAAEQRAFEPNHPTIAVTQFSLALVLRDLGDLAEALDLLRAVYESRRARLGDEHPETTVVQRHLEAILARLPNG